MSIQNIYDDQIFFEGYKALRKNNLGFNAVLEQPALRSLLGNLRGKKILDIGCGFGDFCRFARSEGASQVIGIDPSKNMIQEAQHETSDAAIQYFCSPIETYQTDANSLDMIVSSLAFHYVENFELIIKKMAAWLRPDALLVFSVEHPICTAQPNPNVREDAMGKFHAIYNYREEQKFTQKWFVEGVEKYHRTISTYLNVLLENGFKINKILEPMPSDEQIKENPHFDIHKIRPPLLIVLATKE